jgi:predicted phosphodiesterase
LRRPELRATLLEALDGVSRLVLLGDALELRQGPLRETLAAARPLFAEVGAALGGDGEIVLVPGNHDHALVAPWLERRRRDDVPPRLGLAQEATWEAGDAVAELAAAAAPARVTLSYPGVWLREDVYATHGHYSDRHTTVPTFERLSAGVMGRIVGGLPVRDVGPDDYEAALAPIYAWSYTLAQHADERASGTAAVSLRVWRMLAGDGHRPLRRRALAALFPLGIVAINRAGIGPVRADVSGAALARAGVRGMADAVTLLGIDAAHVVFGHTHRVGPRPDDDLDDWSASNGARLVNCGSWVYERHFLGATPYESPYWPGIAVRVGDEGPPEHVRLLGDRGHAELGAGLRRSPA